MKTTLTILLLCISVGIFAEPTGKTLFATNSPSGNIVAVGFEISDELPRNIYLRNGSSVPRPNGIEDPQWTFLCDFDRWADVQFSPDEEWIAVNDTPGTCYSTIRIFKHESQLRFTETDHNPRDVAWALLRHIERVPYPNGLLHSYADVLDWGFDSSCILVRLSGHGDDSLHHVESWLCVYSLKTRKASVDLSLMNRNAVVCKKI